MNNLKIFTSESVSEGHPDKIADQISDLILDEALNQDENSRVACEVLVTEHKIVVGGEITTTAFIEYDSIIRKLLKKIGYVSKEYGIDYKEVEIEILINDQSKDIAIGVDKNINKKIGAGDQGIMFGFACDETKELMPLPIMIANDLVKLASIKRRSGSLTNAKPDMKSQVTIDYTNATPKINTILMSVQHADNIDLKIFKETLKKEVIDEIVKKYNMNFDYKLIINPTGRFVIGGPAGDAGLTGRKIIVDTYGGYSRHGGGAFSGKDATKVDRSAAYAARWIAKNVVAAKLCKKCEIQLSYAIGVEEPVSILIETFNTSIVPEFDILKAIQKTFDLSPSGIISALDLKKPIYSKLSTYGHLGREDLNVSWEKLNKVDELLKNINI